MLALAMARERAEKEKGNATYVRYADIAAAYIRCKRGVKIRQMQIDLTSNDSDILNRNIL